MAKRAKGRNGRVLVSSLIIALLTKLDLGNICAESQTSGIRLD